MDRRAFIRTQAAWLAGLGLPAAAKRSERVPRMALLLLAPTPTEQAFREGLADLGYVEGRNVIVERRSAEGDPSRLPSLAAEIVRSKPDLVVAFITQASLAASRATSTIPIVMVAVSDPVGSGLVESLARPGANVTGTGGQVSAVVGKQLALIRELHPAAKRVAVLWNPANPVFQEQMVREARAGAEQLGVELRLVEARSVQDLERTLAALAEMRPDGVLVLAEPLFIANAQRIGKALVAQRLLAVGGVRAYAEAGLLAAYGPDSAESARRAATYADRILKGASPRELPVELPTRVELILNAKTAQAIGVAIPPALLARADLVLR
jgi:putative ABC transport system substrate-binding protein